MKTKHTPGPWKSFGTDYGDFEVRQVEKRPHIGTIVIAEHVGQGVDEGEADAKLIAAAPDLLYACMNFVEKVDKGKARSTNSYELMKAAIKKATE